MLIPCHLHFQFKLNLLIFSPDAKFAGSIKVQTKTQVYDPLAGFVTHVTRVSRFIYMLLCALMNVTLAKRAALSLLLYESNHLLYFLKATQASSLFLDS